MELLIQQATFWQIFGGCVAGVVVGVLTYFWVNHKSKDTVGGDPPDPYYNR